VNNSSGGQIGSNDNWEDAANAVNIATTAAQVGAFAFPAGSRDAAMLSTFSSGSYTANITGVSSASGVVVAEVYDTSPNSDPRVVNLSTRAFVSPSSPMTAGFVISGTANKKVLIRAVGPTLSNFGVAPVLSDPVVTLQWRATNGDVHVLYTNTRWGNAWNAADLPAVATSVGAFALPTGSADSALLLSLPPGTYTAIVTDSASGSGQVLLEVYDVL
jgi:hypothetical protein